MVCTCPIRPTRAQLEIELKELKAGLEVCEDEECGHYKMDHTEQPDQSGHFCHTGVETDEGYVICGCKGFKDKK